MAPAQSLVTHHLPFPLFSPSRQNFPFMPEMPLTFCRVPLPSISCSPSRHAPSTEQEVLRFIAESNETALPCVRTYENDLSRLSLVGAVSFDQALTAAAADGGQAAAEHVDSGLAAMVVETMFPAPNDEHASVSTRLFLPAKKVKERAAKLRKSLSKGILSGEVPENILAMTFRQVVLQKLWNFELVLFRPGTERNMKGLGNPREVPASISLSSSDEHIISLLAEVVCILALQSTEKHFLNDRLRIKPGNFFQWFQKPKRILSKDSSVVVYKLLDEEIVKNAKSLLKSFSSKEDTFRSIKMRQKNYWWTAHSELEKIGGPEFSAWTSEYIPAYRLQIDASRLKDVKFEGWKSLAGNRWEVLLTHCQMVALANILDIYFEDIFSRPGKQLHCSTVGSQKHLSDKMRMSSLLKFLSATLASGILLITISVFGQLCFPHLSKGGKFPGQNKTLSSSETRSSTNVSTDAEKLEAACVSTIKRIKDGFQWPADIATETSFGAWIGDVPDFLRMSHPINSNDEMLANSADSKKFDADMKKSSAQEVASFQVVLSTDDKIVGFQPTSRVGVNNWAVNPLARELYGERKLSPGFLEPGLNIPLPDEIVVIELLMSANSGNFFALARPMQ